MLVFCVNIFLFFIIFCNGMFLVIIFYYWCLILEKFEFYMELNVLVVIFFIGFYGLSDMVGYIDYCFINK